MENDPLISEVSSVVQVRSSLSMSSVFFFSLVGTWYMLNCCFNVNLNGVFRSGRRFFHSPLPLSIPLSVVSKTLAWDETARSLQLCARRERTSLREYREFCEMHADSRSSWLPGSVWYVGSAVVSFSMFFVSIRGSCKKFRNTFCAHSLFGSVMRKSSIHVLHNACTQIPAQVLYTCIPIEYLFQEIELSIIA